MTRSADDIGPDTGLEKTDAAFVADRVDIFRTALRETRDMEWANGLDVVDVIRVAEFLAGGAIRREAQ
ncbi:hypothetical protein [Kitasatospora fiedleri]|uniref:hypothetical protein n=1 Tax=Kitasatospora fiedleri TaxID=2991545 RepID=UPI00249B7BE0|nr:hypothetical protein [Kitasatospora fiedleri]